MIENQIINKLLDSENLDFIYINELSFSQFHKYRKEIDFIHEHFDKYGVIPDKTTFLEAFPNFELLEIRESDEYLVNTLNEQDLFTRALPILRKSSEILEVDSNDAVHYLMNELDKLNIARTKSIDLMTNADVRYNQYLERQEYKAEMFTYSGFPELDKIIDGFASDGELAVFFARLNNGKSWVVTKVAVAAWQQGRRVGFYSGEMTKAKVGYRIDSLYKHFSNRALVKGYEVPGYKEYIEEVKKSENPIQIITTEELNGYLTLSQLEAFIKEYKLDIMILDQLSLIVDETSGKNTLERTKYSNITKGLIRLSKKYHCPIILAAQANRLGAKGPEEKGLPEMENIAESDAVGQDATLAISMRIKDCQLEMQIKKYRDGIVGNKFVYALDLDHGQFTYLPDEKGNQEDMKIRDEIKNNFDNGKDVF